MLEKVVLDEFILIIAYQDVTHHEEESKFNLIEIYQHIVNCDIHNPFFVNYVNKLNRNPHIITQNVKYLSECLRKDENSTTN